jgi:hypothetical protein
MTTPPASDDRPSDEHIATVAALVALDHLIAAEARGDEAAADRCMERILHDYVFRGRPALTRTIAATRLGALCAVLVRQTADRMTTGGPCGGGHGHVYGIRAEVGGQRWEAMEPHDQAALGAVVTAMNGDWHDAHQLVYRFALAAGPSAMVQMFVTLIGMNGAARDPEARPRPA